MIVLCSLGISVSIAQAAIDRDMFLDTCLKVAEARDPKLQVAKQTIELAGTRAFRSGRAFFPAVQLQRSIEKGVTASGPNITAEEYQSEQIGVRVSQPIFAGGRFRYTHKYDRLSQEVAQLQYTKLREELFFRIKSAYYELLAARAESDKLKDAFTDIQRLGAKSEIEYRAKAISALDLEEAKIFQDKVEAMYKSAELNSRLSEEKLRAMVHINSIGEIIYELPTDIAEPHEISFGLKECFGFAVTNNLDVKISELFVQMSRQKKNVDIARVLPNLTAEGFYGKSGDAYVTDPLELSTIWTATAHITWGLWGNTFEATQTQSKTDPSAIVDAGTKVNDNIQELKLGLLDDTNYYVDAKEDSVNFSGAQADNQETVDKVQVELHKSYNDYLISLLNAQTSRQESDLKGKRLSVLRKRNEMYEVTTLEVMDGIVRQAEAIAAYSKALSANYVAVAELERMTLVPLR